MGNEGVDTGEPLIKCLGEVIKHCTFMRCMGITVLDESFASFWQLWTEPTLSIDASWYFNNTVYANHSCCLNCVLTRRFVNCHRSLVSYHG